MSALEAKIPCPRCGKSFAVPLTEMAPGTSRPCPNCGVVVKFSGQDPSKIQGLIDELGSQAPGASTKVTVKTKGQRPWWKFWS